MFPDILSAQIVEYLPLPWFARIQTNLVIYSLYINVHEICSTVVSTYSNCTFRNLTCNVYQIYSLKHPVTFYKSIIVFCLIFRSDMLSSSAHLGSGFGNLGVSESRYCRRGEVLKGFFVKSRSTFVLNNEL